MIQRLCPRGLLKVNNQVLFIEYQFKGEIFYALPGGKQEKGESVSTCVEREFLEETGISVKADNVILVNEFIERNNDLVEEWKEGSHQTEIIFLMHRSTDASEQATPKVIDIGMTGVKWFSPEELAKVTYYPAMPVAWFFEEDFHHVPYLFKDNQV